MCELFAVCFKANRVNRTYRVSEKSGDMGDLTKSHVMVPKLSFKPTPFHAIPEQGFSEINNESSHFDRLAVCMIHVLGAQRRMIPFLICPLKTSWI